MKILIIEDNDILRNNIKTYLELNWFDCLDHPEYEMAIYKTVEFEPDLIILDLWLWSEDWDWLDICRNLRMKGYSTPILILTARTLTKQKVAWLDSWADDYMVKPFDYEEMLARINALIRRNQNNKWEKIIIDDLVIDTNKKSVELNKKEIELTKIEFWLLLYLARNKWKVISKDELLEKVWWDYDKFEKSRAVDIYVWYLRKKLWSEIIETKRWLWYIIN